MAADPSPIVAPLSYATPRATNALSHGLGVAATVVFVAALVALPAAVAFPVLTYALTGLGLAWLGLVVAARATAVPPSSDDLRARRAYAAPAIVALAIASVGISAGLVAMPSRVGNGRRIPPELKCQSTLRQIGTAIELYARENRGAFPPSFEVLMVQQDLPASTFICRHSGHTPATGPTCQVAARRMATVPGHCSYVYLAAGRKTTTVRATEIVAYEPPGTHSAPGMAALFGDGHTEWLDATAAATALAQVNAGVSPVCLPPAPTPTRRIAQ